MGRRCKGGAEVSNINKRVPSHHLLPFLSGSSLALVLCSRNEDLLEDKRGEDKDKRTKKWGAASDPSSPTNRPSSQSALPYANELAAPQSPCPGADVIRTSLCLALQRLRQKQQKSGGKSAGEGPFVRKEYSSHLHRRLWTKHVVLPRVS
ncbi:hypothetical protein Q8A73_001800 [Channa argus]|nr:hypothetical protein Q8A73_001800 [Channa argus]